MPNEIVFLKQVHDQCVRFAHGYRSLSIHGWFISPVVYHYPLFIINIIGRYLVSSISLISFVQISGEFDIIDIFRPDIWWVRYHWYLSSRCANDLDCASNLYQIAIVVDEINTSIPLPDKRCQREPQNTPSPPPHTHEMPWNCMLSFYTSWTNTVGHFVDSSFWSNVVISHSNQAIWKHTDLCNKLVLFFFVRCSLATSIAYWVKMFTGLLF